MTKNKKTRQKQPSKTQILCEPADKPELPVLKFSPYAWAKLIYFRDRGQSEIGGFGITASDDLLYIEDFITVKQQTTVASICFDDSSVADFFDDQIDKNRPHQQFARIWLHTHPGDSCEPSYTDEETFERVFGDCDWAVMAILAKDDSVSARLRFNTGPGGQIEIPAKVDFTRGFDASDRETWEAEYQANINIRKFTTKKGKSKTEDEDSQQDDEQDDQLVFDDMPWWCEF